MPSSSRVSKGVKIDTATCGGSRVESGSEQMFDAQYTYKASSTVFLLET